MIHRSDETGATPEMYLPHLPLLPDDAEFVPLKGGNHLGFGRFIPGRIYRGEPPADLPNDDQLALVTDSSVEFLQSVSNAATAN
jgi:hypothetical protein